ncbi:DUF805 domain-containing protein [Acinetobacter brisouii]|uniref:DUF805 domain-containing protein n=1 Tax=Acinetobacter brisouii TaxID=396323 RepID=UPI00124E196F|nr:DUF805 domain-containing protein [Acinetobacter brisouii]
MPTQSSPSFFGKVTPQPRRSLLSGAGRLGRLSYIARSGLCHLLMVSLFSIAVHFLNLLNWHSMMFRMHLFWEHPFLLMFGGVFLLLTYAYLMSIFLIQRLHDLNQSGWLSLLLLIPVLNLIFGCYVVLAGGTPKLNAYGVVPHTALWEKLCAWGMIVFFLLGLMSTSLRISYLIDHGQLEHPQRLIKHSMQYF